MGEPRPSPGTPPGTTESQDPRDPQGPQGPHQGSSEPLETSKGHPGNPHLAPQLPGQSAPEQLIDYMVGFWVH